jgi:subtilisin family serine protease
VSQTQILGQRYEFSHSVLLIPKFEIDELDEDTTVAPSALTRTLRPESLQLRIPDKLASNALQRIGMKDMEKVQRRQQPITPEDVDVGMFARLNSVGMTAAFFGAEKHEANAINELADYYDFIPNFRLSLPSRVRMDEVPSNRGRSALADREWPEDSGVSKAHTMGVKGAGVLVGVLDSGVDADHEEFTGRTITYRFVSLYPNSPYWPSRDVRGFDTDGHGTHVSGIIVGRDVGVAPESALYVASVIENERTRTSLIRVAHGLDWMLRQFSRPDNEQRPAVLNMSLGFPSTVPQDIDDNEFQLRIRAIRMLLRTLVQANVLPVIAIGNDGAGEFGYPGAFKDVLGVGAVNYDGKIAEFSGSGNPPNEGVSKPDLVGYGVGVYSSIERDYQGGSVYERLSGTSMAAPYVSGVAALYRCRQPTMTVPEVRDMLLGNAKKASGQTKSRYGAGIARFVP